MSIIYEDEAGKIHVQLREFGAFKRNRKAMAEWVASFQPQQVVMESTRFVWGYSINHVITAMSVWNGPAPKP
uniref:Uncharacterized protein n=1 Tax=Candidatus Kentrum sp. LPFa TaxID=2126335 RepID=A0A450Y442_9GAMM|nr:MAG: hypothetical protein BECKLPF1236A_GA0070988_106042 [Candidatus Kentron sp. LPFa]VFK36323.1 MAG: hypothetical protein BECKLPF1236C_GA0070990_105892 [Candidatus Kentron sp. LPFa]